MHIVNLCPILCVKGNLNINIQSSYIQPRSSINPFTLLATCIAQGAKGNNALACAICVVLCVLCCVGFPHLNIVWGSKQWSVSVLTILAISTCMKYKPQHPQMVAKVENMCFSLIFCDPPLIQCPLLILLLLDVSWQHVSMGNPLYSATFGKRV